MGITLSDAVEADNAPDIAHALDLFLRMTDALVKPKRGGVLWGKEDKVCNITRACFRLGRYFQAVKFVRQGQVRTDRR